MFQSVDHHQVYKTHSGVDNVKFYPGRAKYFSLLRNIQTSPGVRQPLNRRVQGALSPWISSQTVMLTTYFYINVEVKNAWAVPPLEYVPSWREQGQGQFYFARDWTSGALWSFSLDVRMSKSLNWRPTMKADSIY
jgi:hypothetical protein